MTGVKFKHTAKDLPSALGITSKRADKLRDLTIGVMNDEATKGSVSQLIEAVFNMDGTPVEKLYCMYNVGRLVQTESARCDEVESLLKYMSKRSKRKGKE